MPYSLEGIDFETHGPVRRLIRRLVLEPVVNYVVPPPMMRAMLRLGKSELAAANWTDPGGWRSMVISYDGKPPRWADKMLVNGGAMSMALRNRRRLAARVLAQLIDECPRQPVQVLCVGGGPGLTILEAMRQAHRPSQATMVDLSDQAHDHARQLARQAGLEDRFRYVTGDIRSLDLADLLSCRPDIVKLIGICEYLGDRAILEVAQAVWRVAHPGTAVVFNSLSFNHGTDRFLRKVFGLHMIHRSPRQLQSVLAQAGFGEFECLPEPLGVYHICVGRKLNGPSH